jgi:beta-glucuronidase
MLRNWAPGSSVDAGQYLDKIHAAFPDKPIVISEYAIVLHARSARRDEPRMESRTHDLAIRSRKYTAGAIFFCYGDYRTCG